MTTITIDRELLEQALVALSAPNHCVFSEPPICVDIRAALAAPATAPEPICTKCGDVITAHDPGLCGCCLSTRDATSPEQKDRPINCGTGHCSCIECAMPGGPLLKDKP